MTKRKTAGTPHHNYTYGRIWKKISIQKLCTKWRGLSKIETGLLALLKLYTPIIH
jgi:hypothetical protein